MHMYNVTYLFTYMLVKRTLKELYTVSSGKTNDQPPSVVQQRSTCTRLQVIQTKLRTSNDITDVINVGGTEKGGAITRWRFSMYTNPQCRWNSQVRTFSDNRRYKCTTKNTMYDVGDHSSLPTSTSIALGLLEKKEERRKKDDEQFCVGGENAFLILWRFTSIFSQF